MRPIIGIPLGYTRLSDGRPILFLGEKVRRVMQKAGGEVFPIVPVQDIDYIEVWRSDFPSLTEEEKKLISANLDRCDGIFFPGGKKFTPYDEYLLELAIFKKIPILGVCLGMQMMSCYQEEVRLEENGDLISHNQLDDDTSLSHEVIIDKNSKLYQILGKDKIMVNSFHNYHGTNNHIYRSVAMSLDHQLEAIEYPGDTFNLGVQWHPEISYEFDINSKKIIDTFIEEARKRSYARKENSMSFI